MYIYTISNVIDYILNIFTICYTYVYNKFVLLKVLTFTNYLFDFRDEKWNDLLFKLTTSQLPNNC